MADWLLWLGGIFNEQTVLNHSAISPAGNRWQAGLVKAIIEQKWQMRLMSHLPEPIWPRGQVLPGRPDHFNPDFSSQLVSYWNIPVFRSASKCRSYRAEFRKLCQQHGNPSAIISYNPTAESVATGLLAQQQFNVPWVDICADSYDPGTDWSGYTPGAHMARGHVFLSQYAYESCPFPTKLHLDGGISQLKPTLRISSSDVKDGKKIILYTGMMSVWGGVSFLLKAFERVQHPEVELWVCGHGQNSDLESALKQDPRIKFFGLVSEEKLEEICQQAAVFVNPRPSQIAGNNMNFPSKILQYLSYGKPVISTWTPGLSPEYREVLEIPAEESNESLARAIDGVLNWSNSRTASHSKKIREFMLKKKTWSIQARRLMDWMKNSIL